MIPKCVGNYSTQSGFQAIGIVFVLLNSVSKASLEIIDHFCTEVSFMPGLKAVQSTSERSLCMNYIRPFFDFMIDSFPYFLFCGRVIISGACFMICGAFFMIYGAFFMICDAFSMIMRWLFHYMRCLIHYMRCLFHYMRWLIHYMRWVMQHYDQQASFSGFLCTKSSGVENRPRLFSVIWPPQGACSEKAELFAILDAFTPAWPPPCVSTARSSFVQT